MLKLATTLIDTCVQQDSYTQCTIEFCHSQLFAIISFHTMIHLQNTYIAVLQVILATLSSGKDMHPYIVVCLNLPYFSIYQALNIMNEFTLKLVWTIMNGSTVRFVNILTDIRKV